MTQPLVSLEAVSVTLGGSRILSSLTWQLNPNEHWAVLGENGSGKSTLLRLLRGDGRPAQDGRGRIIWALDGTPDSSPLAARPLAAMVSAEMQRNYVRRGWRINGIELILSGLVDNWLPSFHDEFEYQRAVSLAESLDAGQLLEMPVSAMSQGQLRLMLVARALITGPRLLLLDEAYDGLDAAARLALDKAAAHAVQNGATLVATAHRSQDLPACLTHALVLDAGKAMYSGPLAGCGKSLEACGPAALRLSTPAPQPHLPEFAADDCPYVLEMRDANVFVNRIHVLKDINWRIRPGENWRVAGANGSGKSTLLRTLCGLEQVAWGGSLRWFGRQHPPLAELHRHVGVISDLLHAEYRYDELSGRELVWTGFDGSVGLFRQPDATERDLAERWMDRLDLLPHADKPLYRLSSGLGRRFFLARALVAGPRVLLLDEPCSGMDAPSRTLFLESVLAAMSAGVQCVYVSHHEHDLPPGMSHELCLEGGRVARQGPMAR